MTQDINNIVFKKAQEILTFLMNQLFLTNNDKIIYHYTSPAGLEGILKNKVLWFTRSDYLNDSTEMNYIFDSLDKALDENKYAKEFCEHIRNKFIKNNIDFHCLNYLDDYYICSFSKAEDELNMWNYYSKTESKAGYNISFKTFDLINSVNGLSNNYGFDIGDVIYGDEVQTKVWNPALEHLNKLYLENIDSCKNENSEELNSIDNVLIDILLIHAPFIKHPAFKNEAELRIVYRVLKHKDEEINIREQNGIFIPYHEVPFQKEIVQSVMISPYVKSYNKVKSMQLLLDKYGYDCKVNTSSIPIRY